MPHILQGEQAVRTGCNLGVRWNRMGTATRPQTLGFLLGALCPYRLGPHLLLGRKAPSSMCS